MPVDFTPASTTTGHVAALAWRSGLLAVLWVALVGPSPSGLAAGAVALPLAAGVGLALAPPEGQRLRPLRLAWLLPLFLWRALGGSFDVARRALQPRMPLAPGLLRVPLHLASPSARLLLASLVSLVPGSLVVEVAEQQLTLHLLDASPPGRAAALAQVRRLQSQVARLYALPPPAEVEP